MPSETLRRAVLLHGGINFLIALLMGFPLAAAGPHGRIWLGSHITALLTSLFVVATGLTWRDLRLPPVAEKVLAGIVIANAYIGALAGTTAGVLGIPGPVATGQQAATWQLAVLAPFLFVLILGGLTWAGLWIFGLRGRPLTP
jgi:hypothetical protein